MAFKRTTGEGPAPESPQALFQDLKGRKVAGLLDQQGEVLRNYMRALDEADVAIQMPTGSGKTLIGLLIAEWRRRKFGEKTLYLCPTKQLVMQVSTAAQQNFALRVVPFVGPKSEYSASSKDAYLHGEAVAVIPYSALFNSAPFFEDSTFILLDDAHSAENYIAKNWSLDITTSRDSALFDVVVSVLSGVLSFEDLAAIKGTRTEPWDRSRVQKVPTPDLLDSAQALREVLDEHCTPSHLFHPWRTIRDHLDACHLYISPASVLIRPLIPPTWTHLPFASAKQRVYMSATLGEGGDLERVTGRHPIHRLPPLDAYRKRGVGRRFFMFPERSLEPGACNTLLKEMIDGVPRALYLVPDSHREGEVKNWVEQTLKAKVYSGADLEQSKNEFVANNKAVCVAASRYDGIDLKGDECRLLIVDRLPSATNLQERFLVHKMTASALLSGRILTRVVQAFGRCTRADTDYAAVVVFGEDFQKLLASSEQKQQLNPELQAEIEFGNVQSKGQQVSGFVENFRMFLKHSEDWDEVEADIRTIRDKANVSPRQELADLQASVVHEIAYQAAMWNRDYPTAVGCARQVLAALTHVKLRGYRGLWSYLAGAAAWCEGNDSPVARSTARTFFGQAAKASQSVPWLHRLARLRTDAGQQQGEDYEKAAVVVERMHLKIQSFGLVNDSSFVAEERFILEHIRYVDPPSGESESERQARSNKFEEALVRLGSLLGYVAGNSGDEGAPDPWWIVDSDLAFVFEVNVGGRRDTRISVAKAREAASHPQWIRANVTDFSFGENAIVPVIITPATRAHVGALAHLACVSYWHADGFCEWVRRVLVVVRRLRDLVDSVDDDSWRSEANQRLGAASATPESLMQLLRNSMAPDKLAEGDSSSTDQ